MTDKLNQNPFANPSNNYEILIQLISDLKQKILPRKKIKFNKKKHKKSPWMTRGILNSINAKDKLYKSLINTLPGSARYDALKVNFKTLKKIIRRSIVQAKKQYYHMTFKKYSNDLRKTWRTINETLNRKNKAKSFPQEFCMENGNNNQ